MDTKITEDEVTKKSEDPETEGVKILLGEPGKAIVKLAYPMIIAMSASTIYNVVDAFWVSGLGANALAAIGFSFPFFFMAIAISIGLGIGGGSSVSRKIGAKNKSGADSAAIHTIIIMIILAIIFSIPLVLFIDPIFSTIGAEESLALAVAYGRVIFGGAIFIFFIHTGISILRAEGDAKRAMYLMITGSALNIILDPIFIYTLGLGVAGAAWATVLSMGIISIPLARWMFFKNDTYLSYNFKKFKWNYDDIKDIMKVGVPSMVMQLSIAITMLILFIIILGVANEDGIAIHSTGWRVISIGVLPLLGIATAVTSVTGAAFGARNFENLKTAYYHALKIGIMMGSVGTITTFILAPQISAVFTQAEAAAHIQDDLITFFMITCIFYPAAAAGIFSSAMFQGVGKGMNALIVTVLRTVILTVFFTYFFAHNLGLGLTGVWWGIVAANLIGSAVAFLWAKYFMDCLVKDEEEREEDSMCSKMALESI